MLEIETEAELGPHLQFEPRDQRPNHLARLVALWQTDPDYGATALPRSGPAPSFEALAWAVRRDVHPRTMLDALLASGTVTLDPSGQDVRLEQTSYQPLAGSEDQLAYLTRNLGDHLSTATDNVLGLGPPQFERSVHYSGLDALAMVALAERHRKGQMELFEDLSARAAALKRGSAPGTLRFRAGAYLHQSEEERP